MDDLILYSVIGLLGLGAVVVALVIPFVALAAAGRARRELEALKAETARQLANLRGELSMVKQALQEWPGDAHTAGVPIAVESTERTAPGWKRPLEATAPGKKIVAPRETEAGEAAQAGAPEPVASTLADVLAGAPATANDNASEAANASANANANANVSANANANANANESVNGASASAANADAASARAASASAANANAASASAATPVPDTQPVAADVLAARRAEAAGGAAAPPPPTGTGGGAKPPAPSSTLEEKIALVWFTRIGAAILLLGVAYFFKYAVDNQWIGPTGRVAIGAFAGLCALLFGHTIYPKTKPIYTQMVQGVGLSLLLLSAYASFAFYHLVPMPFAFGAFFIIALLGGAMAMHYRGQAILILSLAAALSAPVLLSTGEDRPLALFGYVLVVTALSHAASLRMKFVWSLWLGIAGSAVLFLGWYAKFFDAHPMPEHPMVDLPREQLEGAYFALASRAVPLGAVAAFLVEWLLVYRSARPHKSLWPIGVLVAASLLAHVGAAALLYDHPLLLGGLLSTLGVLSAVLLAIERKSELLLLPLVASFGVLVAAVHASEREQPVAMLSLLALWAAVYVAGFLRGQLLKEEQPSPKTLGLVGGVGFAFAVLSAALLAHPHPLGFALVMVALSVGYGVLGVSARAPVMVGAAIGLTFMFLLANMPHAGERDLSYVGVAAAWAAVYLGAVAWELVVKRAAPTASRLLVVSGAGLGFAFFAESHTGPDDGILRAAMLAAVGVIDLGIGAALLRRDAKLRRPATVLLGQALGLFAAAVAVMFTGVTVTLVWAVLSAVVVVLAAQEQDAWWLAGGLVLFAATVMRVLAVDAQVPEELRRQFFSSHGAQGLARVPFLLNTRAYALAGVGAALLVAARAAIRPAKAAFRRCAVGLFIVGHALLLGLFIEEGLNLALTTPAPPLHAAADEFDAFVQLFARALADQLQTMSMLTTTLMGLYAAGMVAYGFGRKDRLHRYLGLGLFAVTLVKLALWDVWRLQRVYQILVLVAVGALLLGASFLYARFGKRLVTLVRDGGIGPTLALVAALGVLGLPARAHAFDAHALAQLRVVEGVDAPGFYRVEIDPALYRASLSESWPLADLRLAGPDGKEVAYLVRAVPVVAPPVEHAAVLVDPVTLPNGSTRAVLDLGRPGLKHSEVQLRVGGGDFMRRARVEVSGDEREWAVIAEGALVYRVTPSASPSEHTRLRYPTSDARYLRVTLLPWIDQAPIPILGASVYYVEPGAGPLRRGQPIKLVKVESDTREKRTRALFDLGDPGVPYDTLLLTIRTPAFERRATVAATNHQSYWPIVGSGVLYRSAAAMSTGGPQEDLRLPIRLDRKRWARVEIEDGDDPPLLVEGALAEWRAEELVFQARTGGLHTLYAGDASLPAPSYDLPSLLARAGDVPMRDARFGPLSPNPQFGQPAVEAPKPMSERYRLPIAIAMAVVLGLLALWTLKLLKRSSGAPGDRDAS